jgi:hypothetical protein
MQMLACAYLRASLPIQARYPLPTCAPYNAQPCLRHVLLLPVFFLSLVHTYIHSTYIPALRVLPTYDSPAIVTINGQQGIPVRVDLNLCLDFFFAWHHIM